MKIDLHCHTLKCKEGDPEKRNVTKEKFIEKVNKAGVSAVAITNHNTFNIEQYNSFLNDDFMVWPGIELDVEEKNVSSGHCILIVSPSEAERFSNEIKEIVGTENINNFKISVEKFALLAIKFNSIISCHYGKSHSLNEESIEKLRGLVGDVPLFLEPSQLLSAGIFMAHNKESILGSDVKDWDSYENYSFPELKMNVDTYDRLKLLIKKDKEIIKTFIDKKRRDSFEITPFESRSEVLNIQLYNDTNVLIGGKGTGKTKILQAIEDHYKKIQNNSISSYYAHDKDKKFSSIVDVECDENDYDIIDADDCYNEIKNISEWEIPFVEKTSNYYQWITDIKDGVKFGFCDCSFNELISEDNYNNELDLYSKNKKALNDLLKRTNLNGYLGENEATQFSVLCKKLLSLQMERVKEEYCEYKSLELVKFTIEKMKKLYQIHKGKSSKPNNCGYLTLYQKCLELYNDSKKVLSYFDRKEKSEYKYLGPLQNKGYIYVKKQLTINPNKKGFKSSKGVSVENQKKIKNVIAKIKSDAFSSNITQSVSSFKDIKDENNFLSLKNFLRYKVDLIKINGKNPEESTEDDCYTPSNGEKSMLILNNALFEEKDIYVLDEPEMSVGHDYVNTVIVPRIIELAKLNRIVIVSTHDANIAVRTLPFTTIYRVDGGEKKKTYVGNPFNEEMINVECSNDKVSWAQTCIDTLEGGSIAFRERGDSYGRNKI